MDRHAFLQALAAPGAAIAVPMDLATMNTNLEAGDVSICFGAGARGELND